MIIQQRPHTLELTREELEILQEALSNHDWRAQLRCKDNPSDRECREASNKESIARVMGSELWDYLANA